MKKSRKLAPSKYLRKYGKAKISRPMITKEEVEAVLECEITDERYEELLEASRLYSLSNSDKHVNLAQDAEHNRDWEGAKKHWKNAALASIKHDTIHKTQRSDKLKVRGITMRKEEVEQIDETFSANKNPDTVLQSKKNKNGKLVHVPSRRTHQPGWSRAKEHFQRKQDEQDEKDNEMFRTKKWRSHKVFAKHLHKGTSRTIGQSRAKLLLKKRGESVDEAVELSASRKTKVNALLAKHQAKGLPSKPSKKYTREYTGDGLPLIAAVINQEETLNETKE